jgi:hypothetical protein
LLGSLRDRAKWFFITPGGRLNWRTWWLETRWAIALGGLIGIGASFLVLLLFMYPAFAGYVSGAAAAGLLSVLTYYMAHYLYNLRFSPGKGLGIFILVLGIGLAVLAFFRVSALARTAVAEVNTSPAWLFLDGLLVGAAGGAAYGNYRTLSLRKSKALSLAASLLLAAALLSVMWLIGLFDLPFEKMVGLL